MELDFGGIGKEYAVDRVAVLLSEYASTPLLIDFGGDLRVIGPPPANDAWRVGIESIAQQDHVQQVVQLRSGALAISGDTRHVIEHAGKRYGHIIDARPVGPRNILHAPLLWLPTPARRPAQFLGMRMRRSGDRRLYAEVRGPLPKSRILPAKFLPTIDPRL